MPSAGFKLLTAALFMAAGLPAIGQNCQLRDEMNPQARSAIESAAQQTFTQVSQSDVNSLRSSAIPSLQSNFNGIAGAVNDNKAAISGAAPQMRTSFLLDTGPTPSQDGSFYCGVFGANGLGANGAEFSIPGLPVGKYGVVIQDFVGSKGPYALTTIYQDMGGWKLAGLYIRAESAQGHDGLWYLQKAREYKSKGQNHNAWFYYSTAWELLAPVTFMDTTLLSKITRESTAIQPKDVPGGGNPITFSVNGKSYKITDMTVYPNGNNFDLNLKFSVPSTADFNATVAEARNLANAFVAQNPELKEIFNNVWAHAVDPSGGDAAGLLNLKPSARP
jgi:hypothetical protein